MWSSETEMHIESSHSWAPCRGAACTQKLCPSPWQSGCSWDGTGQGKHMQELGNRKQRCSGAGCGHSAGETAAEVALSSAHDVPCSQSLPSLLWPQLQQPKQGSVQGFGEVEGAVTTLGGNPAPTQPAPDSSHPQWAWQQHQWLLPTWTFLLGLLKLPKITFTSIVKSSHTGK